MQWLLCGVCEGGGGGKGGRVVREVMGMQGEQVEGMRVMVQFIHRDQIRLLHQVRGV